ncbi:MAG: Rrf2 family transcriptional regulator, partial [Anaerolineae bacterium]|nr:Rrf2 family transcriptional regulator [Anaerolineae bacterium]
MMELTRKADYALRLMVEVGVRSQGAVRTSDVARRQGIPYEFLRKVVQELVAEGLLISRRG